MSWAYAKPVTPATVVPKADARLIFRKRRREIFDMRECPSLSKKQAPPLYAHTPKINLAGFGISIPPTGNHQMIGRDTVSNVENVAVSAIFAILPLKWQADVREQGAELTF